jgi:glycosyltransferase involved in cell wall biosynthesis
VIVPTFNNVTTIGATLLSIINQQYRTTEIIIIDDGSTDETEAVVSAFKDKRIRYERLDRNHGITHALNKGLSIAAGEIVARMDADDIMMHWRISDQISWMLENNLSIVGAGAEKFGASSGTMFGPECGRDIINHFLVNNPFIHPTVLIDRRSIDISYREDFTCEEDYELWSRVITVGNCHNIYRPLIKYRVAPLSNQNRLEKRKFTRIALEQFCARFEANDAPISSLLEIQLSGLVRYEDYLKIKEYAHVSLVTGKPGLGWMHKRLLKSRSYLEFNNWHLRMTRQARYYA